MFNQKKYEIIELAILKDSLNLIDLSDETFEKAIFVFGYYLYEKSKFLEGENIV